MTPAVRQPLPVEPDGPSDVALKIVELLCPDIGNPMFTYSKHATMQAAKVDALLRAAGCTIDGEGKL